MPLPGGAQMCRYLAHPMWMLFIIVSVILVGILPPASVRLRAQGTLPETTPIIAPPSPTAETVFTGVTLAKIYHSGHYEIPVLVKAALALRESNPNLSQTDFNYTLSKIQTAYTQELQSRSSFADSVSTPSKAA